MAVLSLFSSSVQMEHQRNLGYMGFMVIREPTSFVRRVVILRFRWVAGSVERFFQSFLPFDGPCCSWSHYLVS